MVGSAVQIIQSISARGVGDREPEGPQGSSRPGNSGPWPGGRMEEGEQAREAKWASNPGRGDGLHVG